MIKIILYLSGNFPQLTSLKKERAMARHNEEEGSGYNRLMSFYYEKDCQMILTVGKIIKEEYGSEKTPHKISHRIRTNNV